VAEPNGITIGLGVKVGGRVGVHAGVGVEAGGRVGLIIVGGDVVGINTVAGRI
jgi:hypothetical protein